ncbi:MAG: FAD-binding oxidoreductase [Dongiaceae bacterium]
MASYDVVVIGAGITGASTAYHLRQRGAGRVLLLERATPAAGGTGRSAAIVRQHYSTPLMARLALAGVAMFKAMPEELGQDGGYERTGWAFLVPPDAKAAAERNIAMQRGLGIDTRILSPAEVAERLPWLNADGVAAVVWEAEGGFADPVRSTEAYVGAFERAGGEVRLRTPCRGLLRQGDRVTGVMLDEGEVAAGAVVNAAGPWAQRLAELAGIPMTMRTIREQDTVWQARGGRALPHCSVSNAVDAIYLRPLGGGRFVLGRGFPKPYLDCDPENYKQTADPDFVAEVQTRAEHRFPPLQGAALIDSYAALYDVTPDWYQYVGPRAGLAGYYDCSGGSGHGFKVGPAIGRELAGWILDGRAAPDFARLSYDRVARNELFQQAYGGNRG